jgi:hypothetical protein
LTNKFEHDIMNNLKTLKLTSFFFLVALALFTGCKNNDPSVLKIFVRSASNELVKDAKVIIIGDVNSVPTSLAHVDTLVTNSSGFAAFNLDDYFTAAGEENTVAYFDVIVKQDPKQAQAYVRCRAHITTVETVYLPN